MSLYVSSRLKKIGIELGVAPYGTPATTFTHGLLASAFSCNPKTEVKGVPEVRGDFSTRRVTTKAALDHDLALSFPLDLGDTTSGNIGQFLAAIFGIDTKTGSGPSYIHTFSRADVSDPVWFNLFADKDFSPKQYLGFRAQTLKFSLKAGEGLINVDVSGIVKGESDLTNPGVLVFSAAPIVSPQEASVLTFGADTAGFEELNITITRDVQRYRVIGASRLINNALTKSFQIQVDAKGLVFASEVTRAKFLAGTSDSLALTLSDPTINSLAFNFGELYHTAYDGPDIKDTDLLNVSLASLITGNAATVVLTNTRSTAYTA